MCTILFISCTDEIVMTIQNPSTYTFSRNGETSIDFSEQTTLIAMAEELLIALSDENSSEEDLNAMFSHIEGTNDFSNTSLNNSDKNLRDNVAASIDYFFLNETDATAIKEDFDALISEQVTSVFANYSTPSEAGVAGEIKDSRDNTNRYINTQGVELNEFFGKALIGGLMVDQILNNFLSSSVLDADNNIQDNDDFVLVEGKNYTAMEHAWDEAYGFLFGAEIDVANPVFNADSFLSKYIYQVDQDMDFTGIAEDIHSAFKLGRAAIVANDYDVREEQTEIIKEKISLVIAIGAVQSFHEGNELLNEAMIDYGAAFHKISEGIGLLYSLQFTRQPQTTGSPTPYFTKTEIDAYVIKLLGTGNGLWEDTTSTSLEVIIEDIEKGFDYEEGEVIALLTN